MRRRGVESRFRGWVPQEIGTYMVMFNVGLVLTHPCFQKLLNLKIQSFRGFIVVFLHRRRVSYGISLCVRCCSMLLAPHRLYSDFHDHHSTLFKLNLRGLSCPRLVHRMFLSLDTVLEVNANVDWSKVPVGRSVSRSMTTRGY